MWIALGVVAVVWMVTVYVQVEVRKVGLKAVVPQLCSHQGVSF